LHCFLSPFLYIGHRIPSNHSHGIFSCFHIFTINWCIFCFSVRPPFFINSGTISSGPAALLCLMFLIISFISSYVGSSSSTLSIGPSFLYYLFFQSQDLVVPWSTVTIFPVFVFFSPLSFFLIVCCCLYPYLPMSPHWVD